MKPIRKHSPKRTCTKTFKDYRSFKPYLREDFQKRCGYCNDLDLINGGKRGFHIDHFRPQKPYKHLELEYKNLIYACPYCNIAKSNDWPSGDEHQPILDGKGYIDPCDLSYSDHFERFDNGRIRPTSQVGQYMFKRLKLGLRRHQLAWASEQLEFLIDELGVEIDNNILESELHIKLLKHHFELTKAYREYKRKFEETL